MASFAGAYGYRKEVFPHTWFTSSIHIEFEGKTFLAPGAANQMLKRTYGENYMCLPPKEKQIQHLTVGKAFIKEH